MGCKADLHLLARAAAPRVGDDARDSHLGALRALEEFAPDAEAFARAILLSPEVDAAAVYERVRAKLRREPVEDYRLDYEDGYGVRPDAEEDRAAVAGATEVARGQAAGTLPPFIGIRVKSLSGDLAGRALRTLDLFLATLLDQTGGNLPPGFVVTLAKITAPEQVSALAERCDHLERQHGLAGGALRLELVIGTPQSVLDADGGCPPLGLGRAGRGRGRPPPPAHAPPRANAPRAR